MHKQEVAADLKCSRREAGLTGLDVAHLLEVDPARVSRLENGHSLPSTRELCKLTLIYGKVPDHLLSRATCSTAPELKERVESLPPEPLGWEKRDQRLDTLNALAERLRDLTNGGHAA